MDKKEYSEILDVWTELKIALGVLTLPENVLFEDKECIIRSCLEKTYIKIDKMVDKNGCRKIKKAY